MWLIAYPNMLVNLNNSFAVDCRVNEAGYNQWELSLKVYSIDDGMTVTLLSQTSENKEQLEEIVSGILDKIADAIAEGDKVLDLKLEDIKIE